MLRKTSQREAIQQCLEEARRPLSPEEILSAAREQVPGMGIATVYRNIRRMVDEGEVQPVTFPEEPARYEQAGKGHHHHFRCRRCEKVFDVRGCPGTLNELVPSGFRLENHEITLFGLCARCRE